MNWNLRQPPLLLLTVTLAGPGCAEWPRHAHLPDLPAGAVEPGTDPGDAVNVAWAAPVREEDPGNEDPPEPAALALEEGLVFYGSLDGVGWDPEVMPTHEVSCDDQTQGSEYPPLVQGVYAGDVDWVSVEPQAEGTLCATLEIELPEALGESFAYDLLLYDLDPCGNPLTNYDNEGGDPIGLGLYTAVAGWEAEVLAEGPLAVLLAGFIAADVSDEVVPWRLGLSLLPSEEDGGAGICPNLPEAP